MFGWLTERRRKRILEEPFPDAWTEILARNVAAYRLLDTDEQRRLRELVQVFIAEKNWEGCGGLELDDEIRVTIAGCACYRSSLPTATRCFIRTSRARRSWLQRRGLRRLA